MTDSTTGFRVLRVESPFECLIIERINRFVVGVQVGERYLRAHINNTGRLHQFLVAGKKGFCVSNERRGKTDCRLFAVEDAGLAAIVDTQLQMRAFEESLKMGLIPWLRGCRMLRRNASLGSSLIDYLLDCAGKECYLEAKSAVLSDDEQAMYPDCPSERGRRHIGELIDHVRGGGDASLLFVAALPDVRGFKPSKSGDPALHKLLRQAAKAGVVLRSIGLVYDPADSFVHLSSPDLPVDLS